MNTDEKFYENDDGVFFVSNWPSQWFISDFVIDGITYNCCEKRMMHQKAIMFGDSETAELILKEDNPKEHKKFGRLVKNFCQAEWDACADDVVFNANLAKFSQNEELKNLLLATGSKMIVECAPYDNIWGNGLNITDTLQTPMEQWKGTNRLGKALMRVREVLK